MSKPLQNMANHHTSNITDKPFKLLTTAGSSIKIRRELASQGQSEAAKEELNVPQALTDPFADQPAAHEVEAQGRKRKLHPSVKCVVAGVKRLRVETNPWRSFDEMEWDDKTGRLYGRWSFEGGRKFEPEC